MLVKSINWNRKEAKTWLSYAKLNEIVLNNRGDEKAFINAMKGYMCATVLNLHKTKLIIPNLLKLFRKKEF